MYFQNTPLCSRLLIMNPATKAGDKGSTGNLSGERVSKNSPLIHLEGTLDELNSHLGLVKTRLTGEDDRKFVEAVQLTLMKLMAHASDPDNKKYAFSEAEPAGLEDEISRLKEFLPQKFSLVVPGKSETEAFVHIARTVARRAERYFAAVNEEKPLNPHAGEYLNRLSDYLFVLSFKDL